MQFRNPILRTKEGLTFRSPIVNKTEQRNFFPYIQKAFTSGYFSHLELNPMVDTCVSRIANTLSILPINLYIHTKQGTQQAWWEPLDSLLKDPAVEESSTLFYKTLVRMLLTWGNAYIYKGYDSNGNLSYLQLVDPHKVMLDRDQYGRKIFNIEGTQYTEDTILHIPYFGEGYNGDLGKSPLEVHRELIQQNNYIREYISLYFRNGTGSKLLVALGDAFKPGNGNLEKVIEEFNEFYMAFVAGNENAGMPIITPPGSEISKIDMSNNVQSDTENLLRSSDAGICRIFNIPPEIILGGENKYNSLEAKNEDYLQACIQPLAKHITEYLERLIPVERKGVQFIRFSYDDLVETNLKEKQARLMEAYHGGLISLNEFRAAMHMSSIQNEVEGNTRLFPANLLPLTEDVLNSMMARSKLALKEYQDKDSVEAVEDKFTNHNGFASDKTM